MTRAQIIARLAEIASEAVELRDEFRTLADLETLDDDQSARFDELAADEGSPIDVLDEERTSLERRLRAFDRFESVPDAVEDGDGARGGAPQVMKRTAVDVDVNRLVRGDQQVRSAALAILDRESIPIEVPTHHVDNLERLIRSASESVDGDWIARRVVATEKPAYRAAFQKYLASPQAPNWNADEQRAIDEFRAGPQSLTDVSGGFGVPVLIDPTFILTTGASSAPLLSVANIKMITNNVWKGVSTAPAAWSYDAEGGTVSDDSVTVAQPVVTTYMARAFVPYTIEIGMDYPGFASEMEAVISQGYLDLLASQTATGSGSAPLGIFTAIDAAAAQEVVVTTSGALGPIDVLTVWNALGERFRANATWFSSVSVESKFRVNPADVDGLYTVGLTADGIGVINGRRYLTSDYAPAFTGTTGTVNLAVLGDFSNYVVAQRAGMNVEAIPHLFDVTNNRPTGTRGLFAWARHGFDSVNDAAFILLKNAT